jgi:hypothetical protein
LLAPRSGVWLQEPFRPTRTIRAQGCYCMDAAMSLELNAADGRSRGGTVPETGLRLRRHYQHHAPGVPDQVNVMKPRIQCVVTDAVKPRFQYVGGGG